MHCPICPCTQPHAVHALLTALLQGDIDQALQLGLIDANPCPTCTPACTTRLQEAQHARRGALASRERYRSRNRRLARIKAEREAARRAPPAAVTQQAPALPNAAADALARALAKAKARHA